MTQHPPHPLATNQLALPGLENFQLPAAAIAGVDEVGRGALFGPVVAAAVVLPDEALVGLARAGVTDSKQLSATARSRLAREIRAVALDCRVGYASVREIDRLNILQASLLAMRRAVLRLRISPPDLLQSDHLSQSDRSLSGLLQSGLPQLCLVDGNQRIPNLPCEQRTVVKGDRDCLSIAAASIVAKVWRDELIKRLAVRYPEYDLATNKGYGTVAHRRALQNFGPSPWHRKSFSPCRVEITQGSAIAKDSGDKLGES